MCENLRESNFKSFANEKETIWSEEIYEAERVSVAIHTPEEKSQRNSAVTQTKDGHTGMRNLEKNTRSEKY